MKIQIILLFLLIISCTNQSTNENIETGKFETQDSVIETSNVEDRIYEYPIDLEEVKRKISEDRKDLKVVVGSQRELFMFTKEHNSYDIFTITVTADYLRLFLPKAKIGTRDSSYLYFLDIHHILIRNLSDSLYFKFPVTMKKMEEGIEDKNTDDFKKYLEIFGAELLMTEGNFYLDTKPDFFLDIFDNQVSKGLNAYLIQRNKELKEGFSEDGGLKISFIQVYERVKCWENIISIEEDFVMKNEAKQYYNIYLSTLLTGTDNSRIFNEEDFKLKPEIKQLYENIIEIGINARYTEIIKDYYYLLAENDFKYTDRVNEFLKRNNITSVLGVQLHTR
jgi:hypothetical protein